MGMDEQPDILSLEPRPRRGTRRPGSGRWFLVLALLVSLGGGTYLALLAAHQDDTIHRLQTALRQGRPSAPASASLAVRRPCRSPPAVPCQRFLTRPAARFR